MAKQKVDIKELQEKLNTRLAGVFKKLGIKTFRLISMGNSIGTGYSLVRTVFPLLDRNASLKEIMEENDVETELINFSRAQNNNDENIYSWIIENKTEAEVNKMVCHDFTKTRTMMSVNGLTPEQVKEHYAGGNIPIQTLLTETDSAVADVVVYNGATGSFLDGITRNGTLKQKFTYGVKRDVTSIEAILKWIHIQNRKNRSNTQVYLCGAPNFLGIGVTTIAINNKLKKIAQHYPNVTYVEPIKTKFIYHRVDEAGNPAKGIMPDIHYDEEEYIRFNNNIIQSIGDNYHLVQLLINLDRRLTTLSSYVELENNDLVDDDETRKKLIMTVISDEVSKLADKEDRIKLLKMLKKHITQRFPYDLFYLRKKSTNEVLKHYKKNGYVA